MMKEPEYEIKVEIPDIGKAHFITMPLTVPGYFNGKKVIIKIYLEE